MALSSGQMLGRWRLSHHIGKGGNAEVWAASTEEGEEAAIKVLYSRNPGAEPFRRFSAEIEALSQVTGRGGILPLLDSHLPLHPSRADRAWLVTPIADPIADLLTDVPLAEVIQAFIRFSGTLASLAEDGFHHRDLKPENLFNLNGQWMVGDFGLVTFPGKEAVTAEGKKLGPIHYIAPEMLLGPLEADPAPADVFSLAKTIWVLATGQTYPLAGPVLIRDPVTLVSTYNSDSIAPALDVLLQSATSNDPRLRPTMAQMNEELGALVQQDGDSSPPEELPDYRDRVARILQPRKELEAEEKKERDRINAFLGQASVKLKPVSELLERSLPFEVHGFGNSSVPLLCSPGTPNTVFRHGRGLGIRDDEKDQVLMEIGIGVHIKRDQSAVYIGAGMGVRCGNEEWRMVFEDGGNAVLGSALAFEVVDRLVAGILDRLNEGIALFVRLMEEREQGTIVRQSSLLYLPGSRPSHSSADPREPDHSQR